MEVILLETFDRLGKLVMLLKLKTGLQEIF